MKQVYLKIADNRLIAKDIYKMTLVGDTGGISAGQFVNVALDGLYLRRPLSVCDVNGNELMLIYKTVGVGTATMSGYGSGVVLDVLTGLGNGYDLTVPYTNPLLIGGGVGVPPLYLAAKELVKRGKTVTAILGFNTESEAFYTKEFASLGVKTLIATVDGTMGIKGFVTDAMKLVDTYDYFYTCGPEAMLKAVFAATATSGQLSFEERMGCGFGACMGCTCKTVTGYKRICKEGPVLKKEEILW